MSAPGDGDHPFVAAPPLVASEVAFIAVCLAVTPAQGVIDPGKCCVVLHRFHNQLSQSQRRPLLGPSPG